MGSRSRWCLAVIDVKVHDPGVDPNFAGAGAAISGGDDPSSEDIVAPEITVEVTFDAHRGRLRVIDRSGAFANLLPAPHPEVVPLDVEARPREKMIVRV